MAFAGGVIRGAYARNIGPNGVYVELRQDSDLPPGTELTLTFRIWTGTDQLCRRTRARVTRCAPGTLALEFTECDLVGRAVVEDVRFYKDRERRRHPRTGARRSAPLPA